MRISKSKNTKRNVCVTRKYRIQSKTWSYLGFRCLYCCLHDAPRFPHDARQAVVRDELKKKKKSTDKRFSRRRRITFYGCRRRETVGRVKLENNNNNNNIVIKIKPAALSAIPFSALVRATPARRAGGWRAICTDSDVRAARLVRQMAPRRLSRRGFHSHATAFSWPNNTSSLLRV